MSSSYEIDDDSDDGAGESLLDELASRRSWRTVFK